MLLNFTNIAVTLDHAIVPDQDVSLSAKLGIAVTVQACSCTGIREESCKRLWRDFPDWARLSDPNPEC